MIKLANLLPRSLYECVVARVSIDGSTMLAKNRDRAYSPELEVIHEIVNDVEVVYMRDTITDWSEGMNSNGVGIVNASLAVNFDEKEGELAKDKAEKGKTTRPSYDGEKIRTALSKPKLAEAMRSILTFVGQDKKDIGVKGMTIVSNPKHSFVIEMTSKHLPVIKKIKGDKPTVRTNHGVAYPDTGYTGGIKRKSSLSRQQLAATALSQVTDKKNVLDALSQQKSTDKFMNPYRRDNSYGFTTSSQVLMDLDDLRFEFRHDSENSTFKGYVNNLPKGYEPKINVVIETTTDK